MLSKTNKISATDISKSARRLKYISLYLMGTVHRLLCFPNYHNLLLYTTEVITFNCSLWYQANNRISSVHYQ